MHDSGDSPDVSICHTVNTMTTLSLCQSHDSSVCQLKHDSTWNSVQPSARFMAKIPMSIPGQNFSKVQYIGKSLPSVLHWIHLLIHQTVCQSHHHHQLKTHHISPVIMGRIMQ